jgi:hypothetical protein
MEERVALVGGTFKIWRRHGGGTEIFAFIPLTPTAMAPPARSDPDESTPADPAAGQSAEEAR